MDTLTHSFYQNVERVLYKKDKLLFSFILAVKVQQSTGSISDDDLKHLLAGSTNQIDVPQNTTDWLSNERWTEAYRQFQAAG